MDLSFLQPNKKHHVMIKPDVSILVLMDLSFLLKELKDSKKIPMQCFNPCSYGSFVLTPSDHSNLFQFYWTFQSLFLWIFRSYSLHKLMVDYVVIEFQSLFLWIFRSYIDVAPSTLSFKESFNPCSYGSFVLT